jgi:hypothetical protein
VIVSISRIKIRLSLWKRCLIWKNKVYITYQKSEKLRPLIPSSLSWRQLTGDRQDLRGW